MTDITVVYHSQSGANEALAQAAYDGACLADGAVVKVLRAVDTDSSVLLDSKAVVLCFAEMNGAIAGGMKALLDRIFYPLIDQQKVLPALVCMSVGNDGTGALTQFNRIATGMALSVVAEPQIVKGMPDSNALSETRDLAHGLAEGVLMGIY